MQWFWIRPRFQINPGTLYPTGNIFRSYGERAVQSRGHLLITLQSLVCNRDLLEYGKIAWIQLQSLFHFLERLLPVPLPPVDVSRQQGNSRLIRQRLSRSGEFLFGSLVILIRPVKMLSEGQMGLSRFRV